MAFHVNFELKAYSKNIDFIRAYLLEHCTKNLGKDFQKDTYFKTKTGRLKLREGNIENSLIFYNRPDLEGPKQSDVNLVKLGPDSGIREALRKANEIKVVVNKAREIFFIENVKFHLDEVGGLGEFFEIEAIDSDGSIGISKLKEQCDKYIKLFDIKPNDFINNSYSDMIMEKGEDFKTLLEDQFQEFSEKIKKHLIQKQIKTKHNPDHACYRVKTLEEYESYKEKLNLIGDLLIESMVGGRLISTFRLHESLKGKTFETNIIELPQPKPNRVYELGFEHLEFVISEDFKSFSEKHKDLEFDWKGADKSFNPELRLPLGETSVKFHHQTLERVIEIEMAANS